MVNHLLGVSLICCSRSLLGLPCFALTITISHPQRFDTPHALNIWWVGPLGPEERWQNTRHCEPSCEHLKISSSTVQLLVSRPVPVQFRRHGVEEPQQQMRAIFLWTPPLPICNTPAIRPPLFPTQPNSSHQQHASAECPKAPSPVRSCLTFFNCNGPNRFYSVCNYNLDLPGSKMDMALEFSVAAPLTHTSTRLKRIRETNETQKVARKHRKKPCASVICWQPMAAAASTDWASRRRPTPLPLGNSSNLDAETSPQRQQPSCLHMSRRSRLLLCLVTNKPALTTSQSSKTNKHGETVEHACNVWKKCCDVPVATLQSINITRRKRDKPESPKST